MGSQEQWVYNPEEDEVEISLRSLFAALLRSWRTILIWGIICCLLGAGFQAYRSRRNDEAYEKAVAEYERQMANHTASVEAYEKERAAIQADIDDIYSYIEQSVLLKINPYKEAYATADLLFDVEDEGYSVVLSGNLSLKNDGSNRVLAAYTSFLDNGISYEEIGGKYGLEDRYVRELVKYSTANKDSGMLNISVCHMEKEAANDILEYVLTQLEAQQASFAEDIPQHSYTVINRAVRERVDDTLITAVDELRSGTTVVRNVNSLYSKQLDKVDEYNARIEDIDTKLQDLTEPTAIEEGTRNGIFKFALIGLAAGILLGAILRCLKLILRGMLLDRQPLQEHFGLPLLAAFPHNGRGALNRYADRMLGAESGLSQDEVQTVAVNSIRRVAEKEKNTILLAMGREMKENVCQSLLEGLRAKDPANTYMLVPSFGNNLHTQQALDACDGVVLLAEIAKTSQDDITAILNITEQYGKAALGVILYN